MNGLPSAVRTDLKALEKDRMAAFLAPFEEHPMAFPKLTTRTAYLVGLFVVVVWGVTFVNTKVLLLAGLAPSDILFYSLNSHHFRTRSAMTG